MHRARLGIIVVAIVFAAAWLYLVVPRVDVGPAATVRSTPAAPSNAVETALPLVAKSAPAPESKAAPAVASVETRAPIASDDVPNDDLAQDETPDPAASSGPSPIDANHAADLFADQLARQDGDPAPGSPEDPARALWNRFDKEKADAAWSDKAATHLREALGAWLADIPAHDGTHLALVHVECRSSLCQVLAANNNQAGQSDDASDGAEWQQAIAGLHDAPWWSEIGFSEVTTQVTTVDDYILYTTYFARATTDAAASDSAGG